MQVSTSSVLRGAYNSAKHHSKIAQRRAGGRAYNPAKHHSKIAQRQAGGRAYNSAKHHSKIAQRRAGGPQSSVLRCSRKAEQSGEGSRFFLCARKNGL